MKKMHKIRHLKKPHEMMMKWNGIDFKTFWTYINKDKFTFTYLEMNFERK